MKENSEPDVPRSGMLMVVSGPSGSGKTTVCRAAAEIDRLYYTVSCTTRPQRPGEAHGEHYFFLTEEDFRARIAAGEFLEWAEVHGRLYGTLKSQVLPNLEQGRDVVMDLDVQGAAQIRSCEDESIRRALVDVFIAVDDMDQLAARLQGRQSESDETMRVRLHNALEEMRHWPLYHYTIVSRARAEDLARFRAIVAAERVRSRRLKFELGEEKE